MSKIDSYLVRGVLTLTAPAHQSSPEKSGNHTPLMTTRVTTEDGVQTLPYITGNSVRGVLRRLAAEHVVAALMEKKIQIPRDTFLCLVRGAFSRTGMKAGEATIKEMAAARKHVFAGLFGGGARMFPSKLRLTSELMPMVAETRHLFPAKYQAHCVGSAVLRSQDGAYRGSGLTSEVLLTGRDDMAAGRGGEVIENHEEAFREYMNNIMGKAALKKGQKAAVQAAKKAGEKMLIADEDRAKAESLATFATLDVINPGTRLFFSVRVEDATEAQLGLALMAIEDWANKNALGGGSSRGRGSFVAALSLEQGGAVQVANLLEGDAPDYRLAGDDLVARAVAAAKAELAAITREGLDLVYPTSTEVAEAA